MRTLLDPLWQPLFVVILVRLAPLRLVRLGLGELALCARTGRGVLGDRMLGCRGPSTHRREPDDDERDEDDGDDEPGDHRLPPYPAARRRALRLPWRRPEPG